MGMTSRPLERENPSPATTSPNSNGSSTSINNNNNNNSGNGAPIRTPPLTPKQPVSRSEPPNPYPTTFVQADTATFKQVVQMLTGSSETAAKQASRTPNSDPPQAKSHIPPIRTGQKKQGFKLYERRNQLKNGFMISPLMPNFSNPSRKAEILSPSILDFPSLVLSPVTPLIEEDPFDKPSSSSSAASEEEKAIAEKGFYLHPSPRTTTPRDSQPQLLPLFPVTSPRISGESS